jgi:peptidyl-prolyl cis-trans isomerase SurA
MKVGDISRPMVYRTNDNKDAVRIVYYKSRIAPHVASVEEDYNRIQAAALNEKRNKILEKWFTKAQKDVFINIDSAYDFCGILSQ